MRILHLPVNRKKAEGGKPDYSVYRFSREELFVLFAEAAAAGFLVVWLVYDSVFGLPAGDRKSTRLNSSHPTTSRMPSSA